MGAFISFDKYEAAFALVTSALLVVTLVGLYPAAASNPAVDFLYASVAASYWVGVFNFLAASCIAWKSALVDSYPVMLPASSFFALTSAVTDLFAVPIVFFKFSDASFCPGVFTLGNCVFRDLGREYPAVVYFCNVFS